MKFFKTKEEKALDNLKKSLKEFYIQKQSAELAVKKIMKFYKLKKSDLK